MANTATEQDYLSIGDGSNLFDDEAREFFKKRAKLTQYRDMDIKFGRNPSTNDLIVKTGDVAVKQAIKNLIRTDYYERRMYNNFRKVWLLWHECRRMCRGVVK